MIQQKREAIAIVSIGLVAIAGLIFQDIYWQGELEVLQKNLTRQAIQLEQFQMYYSQNYIGEFNLSNGIKGLAFMKDSYFCVYVGTGSGQRKWAEVMETCSHEYLHLKNPEHFKQFADIKST